MEAVLYENPLPKTKRKSRRAPNEFSTFFKNYVAKHGWSKHAMKDAAAAYRSGERNPHMRYGRHRNVFGTEGSFVANPRRHRRSKRHRNPIGGAFKLDSWVQGGGVLDAGVVAAGLVLANSQVPQFHLGGDAANANKKDIVNTLIDLVTRSGFGIVGGYLLGMMGQDRLGHMFALGGVAAGVQAAAQDQGLFTGVLYTAPAGGAGAMMAPPRIAAAMPAPGGTGDVRANISIPPVMGL